MILVLLGTQNNSFSRLLEEIEKCINEKKIEEEVIVQAGYTNFTSNNMKIFDFISKNQMYELMLKARIIISHGGVGSILTGVKLGKKVIAAPRLKEYGEHVNDHQLQIVKNFDSKGFIIGLYDINNLEQALKKIESFSPKKFESNTQNIINIISDYIDKN